MYVTDALKCAVENTARFAGGATLNLRWVDALAPQPEPDERDANEIVADIWARAWGGE